MTGEAIQVFDGTATTVITTTATIANGIFTVGGTNATITQFDNSVDLWPMANLTLELPDTFSAVPTVSTTIDLYMCRDDLAGGTADQTAPTTTLQKGSVFVGSFRLYATDENQPNEKVVSLMGVRKCRFFLKNSSGVTMSFSAGATLKCEGFTMMPKA